MIKESHSDGSTTEYDYNAAGLLTLQKEVKADNSTRRQIAYTYDDAANIISENRSGVDVEKKDELVRYYYDKSDRLIKTSVEGVVTSYTYDLAGNMLSDGESSYSYDISNRLLSKTNSSGITVYTYDSAGNLVKENAPEKTVTFAYTAQGKLKEGVLSDGQSSSYVYNAVGARTENVQIRKNVNAAKQNADLKDGSHNADYLDFLGGNRAVWQRAWESEAGSVHQNDYETVTRHYIPDYLSAANRDIMVIEDGSFVTRYAYDENGARVSAEFSYAAGTARGTANASGEYGENPQSDIAAGVTGKVWYRGNMLGSDLFAVDENGNVVQHTVYDAWGKPLTETTTDANLSGLENGNNFTGYTYDVTLELYFAQNRFYDADNHRFTQKDPIESGSNWYVYCGNNPALWVDPWGLLEYISLFINGAEYKDMAFVENGTTYISKSRINEFTRLTESSFYGIAGYDHVTQKESYSVFGNKLYYEKFECDEGVALRSITNAAGYSDTLSWWYESGNLTVTLNTDMKYNPVQVQREGDEVKIRIYAEFTGEADKRYDNYADALSVAPNANPLDYMSAFTYKDLFIQGVESLWGGSYNSNQYDNFGDYSTINVDVSFMTASTDGNQKYLNINVDTDKPTTTSVTEVSAAYNVLSSWGIGNDDNHAIYVNMYDHYWGFDSNGNHIDHEYTLMEYMHVAAHEMGHVFGLGDAYRTSTHPAAKDTDEVPGRYHPPQDIMRANDSVTPNDIEMLLEAWKTNSWQGFVSQDYGGKSTVVRQP